MALSFESREPPNTYQLPQNMPADSYAFISYQTDDRLIAGAIQQILEPFGIRCFLAHEDIEVSEEWRVRILEEIAKADIFICILSKSYIKSQWCTQESGIAAFRQDMTVIPLSIDGTIPQGFLGNIQAAKVNPQDLTISDLLPGLFKRDFVKGISIIIKLIGLSGGYRDAEANFELILPYLDRLTAEQGKALLQVSLENDQVYDAGRCANQYIPQALKLFGKTLSTKERKFLEEKCREYGAAI